MSRMTRRDALGALMLAVLAWPLGAQAVRGRVTSQADSTPLPGVLVQLLSGTGKVVAQRLSDPRGAYLLSAPGAGSYRLRVLRIGFQPTLGVPFLLADSTTVERSLALTAVGVMLGEVHVTATERCSARGDTTSLGFRAWEQARTALASTISTGEDADYLIDYVTTEARWAMPSRVEQQYEQREKRSNVVRTFYARPKSLLGDSGYVTQGRAGTSFSAPDELVLLSDDFLAQHCIWASQPAPGDDSIVVHFEPTAGRTVSEIKGTLVLSRETAELRHLQFEYVTVQPREIVDGAGGSIAFLRLPTGGWVVREWTLRSPILREDIGSVMGRISVRRSTYTVIAMDEARGEIFRVTRGGARLWSAPSATLRGRIADAFGTGEPGVRVRIRGAADGATTDTAGRFVLSDVRTGDVLLEITPSYADSLAMPLRTARVVTGSDNVPVRINIPTREDAIADACTRFGTPVPRGDDLSLIRGVVRNADGAPVREVDVLAMWDSDERDASRRSQRVTRSGATGEYALCGIPRGRTVTIVARKDSFIGALGSGQIEPHGGILLLDLRPAAALADNVSRDDVSTLTPLTGTATLVGTVHGADGRPLSGVQVRVPVAAPVVRTDDHGEYVLAGLPDGRHDAEIRQLGFAVLRRSVDLQNGSVARLDVQMERVVSLDSVNIVAERSRYAEFDSRRKEAIEGKFLDEAELGRLHLQTSADLVNVVAGFALVGRGPQADVISTRSAGLGNCKTLVIIDNVPGGRIGDVPPALLGAVEFYPSVISAPIKTRSAGGANAQSANCGTIVIWTKR